MENKSIETLEDFLNYFEFNYNLYYEEGELQLGLVDRLGANLGNIESERYPVDERLATSIIERLDTYYDDYVFNNVAEILCQVHSVDTSCMSWKELYNKTKDLSLDYDMDVMPFIFNDKVLSLGLLGDKIIEDLKAAIELSVLKPSEKETDCIYVWHDSEQKQPIKILDYVRNLKKDSKLHEKLNKQISKKKEIKFIKIVEELNHAIEKGILQRDPNQSNNILVYRARCESTPEGWYSENILNIASELYHDENNYASFKEAIKNEMNHRKTLSEKGNLLF